MSALDALPVRTLEITASALRVSALGSIDVLKDLSPLLKRGRASESAPSPESPKILPQTDVAAVFGRIHEAAKSPAAAALRPTSVENASSCKSRS